MTNLEFMNEQQSKVLTKIHKPTQDSSSMHNVKKNPNDECYTSRQDILNELRYWGDLGKFQGKNIICPCDWDIIEGDNVYSITITYNDTEIEATQKIQVSYDEWADTLWSDETSESQIEIRKINLKENEVDDFLKNKLICNFIRTLNSNARRWGVKSITASGYNPVTGKGIKFQDVDYSKYDICITNPPFSLYGEFMQCIVGKIDFIVLAPFVNRVAPNIGIPLMLKQAYFGKNYYIQLSFENPDIQNKIQRARKLVCCDWITSYPEAEEERNQLHYRTGISYEVYKDHFPIMEKMIMKDGTKAIRVKGTTYPDDYDGWMFGPATVLNNLDTSVYDWQLCEAMKYYKEHPEQDPYMNKYNCSFRSSEGVNYFIGILFKKKPQAKEN